MYVEKSGRTSLKKIFGLLIASIFILMIYLPITSSAPSNEIQPIPAAPPSENTIKANSTQEIENIILRINETLLSRQVQKLQDYKTRYSYRGDRCNIASEYISQVFQNNGLDTSYDPFLYKGWKMRNVIGEKPGTTASTDIIIICAHYDSTNGGTIGWTVAPGADDNGSSVAAVLAASEILSDYDFNYTIRFIAFSGEEQGLIGSSHYSSDAWNNGDNITAVINLDMIAYNPDPSVDTVYLVKDYNDDVKKENELVYGPAPAGDTNEFFWLDNDDVYELDCTLYIEEQGTPGTFHKLLEGAANDYVLNYTTGFIDFSGGWGSLAEYENITAWYNYSVSNKLVNFTKDTMQKYSHLTNIYPLDHFSGSSDHASFSPWYPAIMFIESRYSANPHYHSNHDIVDNLNFTYATNITQVAIAIIAELAELNSTDLAPPAHTAGFPPNNGYGQAQPTISIEVTDASSLDIPSIEMWVNGIEVSGVLQPIPLGYNISYSPAVSYTDGQVINVSVSANDTHDHGFNYSWEFQVDAIPPEPPTNLIIEQTRVELEKQGIVLDLGGTYDSKHAQKPSVIFKDNEYKMWYGAADGVSYHMCYANSTDGLSWTKHGIVIVKGSSGDHDSSMATYPSVVFDGEYKMWYSGYDGASWRIMYANSSDGLSWTKHGTVIDNGPEDSLDDTYAFRSTVLKTDEYEMWYSGMNGLKYHVLYANSSDGLTWNKYPQEITPNGIGIIHGDGITRDPGIAYYSGYYHMYFGRYDGTLLKTMYAKSIDGINWTEHGLAIDTSGSGLPDRFRATMTSVLNIDNEIKVWYSAFNGLNWRIMFANMTQTMDKNDITVSWTESTSDDVVRYEVFRESRPSAFPNNLELMNPEFYNVPNHLTPWSAQDESVVNISAYGPVTGSHPSFFLLPDDNIIDISLYMRQDTGAWQKLVQDTEFTVDADYGLVHLDSIYPFTPGATFHAFYNHTATKGIRVIGNALADVRAGASNQSYYYRIRAVDKVGYTTEYTTQQFGKVTIRTVSGWNLISSPFLTGPTPLSEALHSLDWTAARTWDPEKLPNHWTINRTLRPTSLNSLEFVNQTNGIWVESSQGNFSTSGFISNITINLKAGWNLVAYPHHEVMSVSQALAGLPWDRVEVFDPISLHKISQAQGYEPLMPGQGMWVHLTTDAEWVAINL